MKNSPFISIAISTYNRSEKVFNLVNNILKYEGDEIEIIVFNNASNDNTKELLNNIHDARLTLINHEKNIGGILGPLESILKSNAEYVFLCLDKDNIEPNYLATIVKTLKIYHDNNIVFGKCVCNLQNIGETIFLDKQFDILSKMVYISEHPTGLFFRTKDLKSLNVLNEILTKYSDFGFNSELIKAEMTNLGNSLILNIPAFKTEKLEDCKNDVSKTYTSNNLFFHPELRIKELKIYIESLNKLNLSVFENQKMLLKIYINILYASTFEYKKYLNNTFICEHYSIKIQKIKFTSLINFNFSTTKQFIKQLTKEKYKFTIYFNIIKIQLKWFIKATYFLFNE